jgi:hypothetical protein
MTIIHKCSLNLFGHSQIGMLYPSGDELACGARLIDAPRRSYWTSALGAVYALSWVPASQ